MLAGCLSHKVWSVSTQNNVLTNRTIETSIDKRFVAETMRHKYARYKAQTSQCDVTGRDARASASHKRMLATSEARFEILRDKRDSCCSLSVEKDCARKRVFLLPCRHVRGTISTPPAHEELRHTKRKWKCGRWLNHHCPNSEALARRARHITASQWCPREDVLIWIVFDQVEILHVVPANLDRFEFGDRIMVLTE